MFCPQSHINVLKLSTIFPEVFHLRNCVYGDMKWILWKNIQEFETFVLDEVFYVTDEEKRGWIIVVDNPQFEGHAQ